ncbi:hypothetical protein BU25DRAFT_13483 [Macroventuria anomochaeta]|uniref:Uncharacterized protein n=1 Tax=Macroventuria anomochaeta TaxID=301207 RepID=A0ACB6SHW6_9PLEO|nr:uncharacterized protein BU25DRAFT_13483 [Macroventuria anomochaeta]KAF2633826.1 hypothetical protein BU25DRAFT_13483 [Macroventuria anomochaeta]
MLLSHRRLVFTDSQMYFQCRAEHYLESLDVSVTVGPSSLGDRCHVFPLAGTSDDPLYLQNRLVEYYQKTSNRKVRCSPCIFGCVQFFPCISEHRYVASYLQPLKDCKYVGTYLQPLNDYKSVAGHPQPLLQYTHMASSSLINTQLMFFLKDLAWRIVHLHPVMEPLTFPSMFPTWSWASIKARHHNGPSGEYLSNRREPWWTILISNPQIISRSGTMMNLETVSRQGLRYTGFYPELLIGGNLLTEPFEIMFEASSTSGTAYLDCKEPLDLGHFTALF